MTHGGLDLTSGGSTGHRAGSEGRPLRHLFSQDGAGAALRGVQRGSSLFVGGQRNVGVSGRLSQPKVRRLRGGRGGKERPSLTGPQPQSPGSVSHAAAMRGGTRTVTGREAAGLQAPPSSALCPHRQEDVELGTGVRPRRQAPRPPTAPHGAPRPPTAPHGAPRRPTVPSLQLVSPNHCYGATESRTHVGDTAL